MYEYEWIEWIMSSQQAFALLLAKQAQHRIAKQKQEQKDVIKLNSNFKPCSFYYYLWSTFTDTGLH